MKDKLQKRLSYIEKQLEKVRGASSLSDGWQTQRLARKQRKWDELAKERMRLLKELERKAVYSFDEMRKCWNESASNALSGGTEDAFNKFIKSINNGKATGLRC